MIDDVKINEIIDKIVSFYNPDKIILFGSYAQGYANENSDLDILVIKETDLARPLRSKSIRKHLYGIMIPLDLVVYTPKEIAESKDKIGSFIYEALKMGKLMYARPNS